LVTKKVSLVGQLGLRAGEKHVAFDFWNQKLLGVVSEQISAEIEGHDTRVLLLHPLLNRPQLVGISRHITGAFSIQDLSWDAATRTLHGLSELVPEDPYTLFIHLPAGAWSDAKPSASTLGNPIPVRQEKIGNLLSVHFQSPKSPVAWQISF
jgi:hypothetical protein